MIIKPRPQGGVLSLVLSVLFHVLLILLIIGGAGAIYESSQSKHLATNMQTAKPVIQAVAVNQQQVEQTVAEIKARAKAKRQAEIAWQQHLTSLAQQAKKQRIDEQQRLTQLQIQQTNYEKQANAERLKVQQQLNHLQALKAQTQMKLNQLKTQQQSLADQNQQVTAQLKQTQQALAVEQSLAAKKRLQNQLAAEQAEQRKLQQQQFVNQVSRYETLILNAIGKQWIIPQGVNHQLAAKLLVTLASDGTVENVQLLKSSGNSVLDQSAITAVFKASPLPVPQSPRLLKQFQQLQLTVRPEGLLNVQSYQGTS